MEDEYMNIHERLNKMFCNWQYLRDTFRTSACWDELVALQEAADAELLILKAVAVDLFRQGAVHVVDHFLKGSGETLF